MFQVHCQCGAEVGLVQAHINQPIECPACHTPMMCLSGEAIDDTAAAADFDAFLVIASGPQYAGQSLLLGGCAPITVGKQPGNLVTLPGNMVSRSHCKLTRLDFGPSRWSIEDLKSTNGLYVNGERITNHELRNGDMIQIGDYQVRYQCAEAAIELAEPAVAPPPLPRSRGTAAPNARSAKPAANVVHTIGPECPSCGRKLGTGARICTDCGIHAPSGRPLLTSNDLDENVVYGNADTALKFISWLVWVTPLPIPLASMAFGKFKPYAIWAISAVTVLVSSIFFVTIQADGKSPARALMLYPANIDYHKAADRAIDNMPRLRKAIDRQAAENGEAPLTREQLRDFVAQKLAADMPSFHWWQPFTCALLHDPSGIIGFILHLGGNMLFMIVFGSRVNSLIGNVATAIIYPILAVASSLTFMATLPAGQMTPLLGASGAINGLAGMYLILFPMHSVYCAMWIRVRFYLFYKIFILRGFWILLIYFAFDTASVAFGFQGSTAHWAHIGGFLTGCAIGIGLLASRKFDIRNGDLLSVILGKHAWPLIGKPKPIETAVGVA